MGLDFRLRDFAYPVSLMQLKRQFDTNQYLSDKDLETYQKDRLHTIVNHAGKNIPYYRKLFGTNEIQPDIGKTLPDLQQIPFLSKKTLANSFSELTADNTQKFHPMELETSGTTGGQVRFLVDKPSNLLEFVYYWRFWGWHGYRLGHRFAEFSAQHFTPVENNRDTFCDFNPLINRLLINSLLLSSENRRKYITLFKKFRPKFLKGLPSNLYAFALLCSTVKNHGITFRAIFSQGENLFPSQRYFIQEIFSCPVVDSYGHLERTVAISQCPAGNYHIHSDYSIVEFVPPRQELQLSVSLAKGQSLLEIVGTSLHNMSMPLIRYRTGDLAIIDTTRRKCSCGRTFPLVHSIIGRDSDIVITPDRRAITALYVALDRLPGISCGQIIQERLTKLAVKIVSPESGNHMDDLITDTIHSFTGRSMDIAIEYCTMDKLDMTAGKKFKTIISHLPPEALFE